MKKVLQNNLKTRNYFASLPTLYVVCRWAGYGVREYPYSKKNTKEGIPLVYDYYDGNGTCDEYRLISLQYITTGSIVCWTFSKQYANMICDSLNKEQTI